MSNDQRDLVKEFREYAEHPASGGFVPIHPDTLRLAADQMQELRRLLRYAAEYSSLAPHMNDAWREDARTALDVPK